MNERVMSHIMNHNLKKLIKYTIISSALVAVEGNYDLEPVLKCYSQIFCGGSAEIFRLWLFCTDLVAN